MKFKMYSTHYIVGSEDSLFLQPTVKWRIRSARQRMLTGAD